MIEQLQPECLAWGQTGKKSKLISLYCLPKIWEVYDFFPVHFLPSAMHDVSPGGTK